MRLGIRAAFHEANAAGGVHGRNLRLTTLNDSYEPELAFSNTQRLLRADRVFALIGAVGTPTSRAAVPVAQDAGVPFLAPFTGAEFLRDPTLDKVVNLRASYYQETEEMVARLTGDLGVMRIAVFYQNDSFGEAGLEGVRRALPAAQHVPGRRLVLRAQHHRGSSAPLLGMIESEPEAVILVGAYAPVAELVVMARRKIDPVFMSVSFVGSESAAGGTGRGRGRTLHNPGRAGAARQQRPRGRRLSRGAGRTRPRRLAGVRFAGGISGRTARRGRSGGLRPHGVPRLLPGRLSHRQRHRYRRFSSSITVPATIRVRMRCS